MTGDELDSLYWAPPKDFTAERTKLTAAAKGRGDDAAAKRISAATKPTTAAWIVNRLALRHTDTKQRLAELGDRLRAAHAAMDGARIRDLSAEQHQLIDELMRAALEAADVSQPSSAVPRIRPSSDGPSMMPATISPITRGCPTYTNSFPIHRPSSKMETMLAAHGTEG